MLLGAILLILGGWRFFTANRPSSDNYITAVAERGDIENLVTATGILQPHDYVDVGAQVSGQLKKLYVEIGGEVKAGDLLAEIDTTVFKARVDASRALLKSQQAQLKDKIAQAKLASIQYARQQNLIKDNATTEQSLQVAQAALDSARAQQEVLEAQIMQTESSLRVDDANLTYAKIYAPITGTVVSITSRQGQTLNANQMAPTIMRIADLSTMTVQSQVSEADIGLLHPGMPVYFTTLGGTNNRWDSHLGKIQPTPEVTNNVVLYNALFDVANADHRLMTQMSAQIFFITSSAKDALIIPVSALSFAEAKAKSSKKSWGNGSNSGSGGQWANKNKSGQTWGDKPANPQAAPPPKEQNGQHDKKPIFVEVLTKTGEQERRKIVLGVSNRVQAQVIEGLEAGEQVITGLRPTKTGTTKPAFGGGGVGGAPGGMGGGGFR